MVSAVSDAYRKPIHRLRAGPVVHRPYLRRAVQFRLDRALLADGAVTVHARQLVGGSPSIATHVPFGIVAVACGDTGAASKDPRHHGG